MHSKLLVGIAASMLVTAAGCGASGSAAVPKAVTANVSEFKITTDAPKVAAGDVTFTVANKGGATHEFVVVRTDIAADALPKTADGLVAEGGALTKIDEVEDVTPGTSKTMTVKLDPGKYVFFCNLAGHYLGGMHGSVEVVAATAAN